MYALYLDMTMSLIKSAFDSVDKKEAFGVYAASYFKKALQQRLA